MVDGPGKDNKAQKDWELPIAKDADITQATASELQQLHETEGLNFDLTDSKPGERRANVTKTVIRGS